jgi:DNA-binding MarR family transcriptional regulator
MLAKTSNTTRLVDKLLLKEVSLEKGSENRRKIEVLITQKGLDVLAVLDPKVIAHEQFFKKIYIRRNHSIEPIIRKI